MLIDDDNGHFVDAKNCVFDTDILELTCDLVSDKNVGYVANNHWGYAKLVLSDMVLETQNEFEDNCIVNAEVYYEESTVRSYHKIFLNYEGKAKLQLMLCHDNPAILSFNKVSIIDEDYVKFPPGVNFAFYDNSILDPDKLPYANNLLNCKIFVNKNLLVCDIVSTGGFIKIQYSENSRAYFNITLDNSNNCNLLNISCDSDDSGNCEYLKKYILYVGVHTENGVLSKTLIGGLPYGSYYNHFTLKNYEECSYDITLNDMNIINYYN